MPLPLAEIAARRPEPDPRLTDLERSILLTVLYADLFDYPLTEDELYERLVLRRADPATFRRSVGFLTAVYLTASQGYITWRGREHLVEVRRHRQALARDLWKSARRYARWLARVPFVRMVAVSGSLAVENAEDKSDIDLFCITEPRRLWVARLCIVPLSKLTRKLKVVFPGYLCPNYILALNALEVEDHNLFTAHEVVQAVPMWGRDIYDLFLNANEWTRAFLPHGRPEKRLYPLDSPARPLLTRWCERLLRSRVGDVLDALTHRLFLAFYRSRAERAGWHWSRLESAYQRSRYTVPEGGYVHVVSRHLEQRVRERLGTRIPDDDLKRLFDPSYDMAFYSCYDWAGLFRQEYGIRERESGRAGEWGKGSVEERFV